MFELPSVNKYSKCGHRQLGDYERCEKAKLLGPETLCKAKTEIDKDLPKEDRAYKNQTLKDLCDVGKEKKEIDALDKDEKRKDRAYKRMLKRMLRDDMKKYGSAWAVAMERSTLVAGVPAYNLRVSGSYSLCPQSDVLTTMQWKHSSGKAERCLSVEELEEVYQEQKEKQRVEVAAQRERRKREGGRGAGNSLALETLGLFACCFDIL